MQIPYQRKIMKIKLYDLIGIKSGMNLYLEEFYKTTERNGIPTEILSNYNHQNKSQQLPNIFEGPGFKKVFNLLISYFKLVTLIIRLKKKDEYIVVLLYGTHLDIPLFLIGKFSKKVVFDVHETMALDYKNPFLRKILYYFYRTCPNKIIAHSAKIKNILSELSQKADIITVPLFPNYTDPNYETKKIGEDVIKIFDDNNSFNYLFFGNVRPSKGVFDLLAATEILTDDNNINIIIAGQDIFNTIEEYKARYPIKNNVKLILRLLNDDEMKYLFINSNATLLPYNSVSQSGVLQTAASLKTPILTSDIPYFKGVINELPSFGKYTNTTDHENFRDVLISFAGEYNKKNFYTKADLEKYYQSDQYNAFAKRLKTWLPAN